MLFGSDAVVKQRVSPLNAAPRLRCWTKVLSGLGIYSCFGINLTCRRFRCNGCELMIFSCGLLRPARISMKLLRDIPLNFTSRPRGIFL